MSVSWDDELLSKLIFFDSSKMDLDTPLKPIILLNIIELPQNGQGKFVKNTFYTNIIRLNQGAFDTYSSAIKINDCLKFIRENIYIYNRWSAFYRLIEMLDRILKSPSENDFGNSIEVFPLSHYFIIKRERGSGIPQLYKTSAYLDEE